MMRSNKCSSIAATSLFVFELVNKKGFHYGSLIVEPSLKQFYDVRRAHVRPHFQILATQKISYLCGLRDQGFVEVKDPSVGRRNGNDRYYSVLTCEKNHYLNEILVINTIATDEEFSMLAGQLPAKEMAQSMFSDPSQFGLTRGDVRGNSRYDAGYTGTNCTDDSVIPGMFFPHTLRPPSTMPGMNGDPTMETTMFKAGCSVMMLSDAIGSRLVDKTLAYSTQLFGNEERDDLFGRRWAEKLGMREEFGEVARFDATSCFGTGVTADHRVLKTERHVDKFNSKYAGEDHSPTYTEIVEVELANGVVSYVRIGFNIYKKQICCDTYKRLLVNRKIAHDMQEECVGRVKSVSNGLPLHKKFVVPNRKKKGEGAVGT